MWPHLSKPVETKSVLPLESEREVICVATMNTCHSCRHSVQEELTMIDQAGIGVLIREEVVLLPHWQRQAIRPKQGGVQRHATQVEFGGDGC